MRFKTASTTVAIFASLFLMTASLYGQGNPTRAKPQIQCVRVFVDDKGKTNSAGSGAYIAPKIVITAAHVVRDRKEDRCVVLFPDWQHIPGSITLVERDPDLAVVELDREPIDIKPMPISRLRVGQKLSIQGYGGGIWRQVWGTLSDTNYDPYRKVSDAYARNGDSGGPIIDDRGRYVGTLWGSRDDGTYFTPAEKILEITGIEINVNYPPVILRD